MRRLNFDSRHRRRHSTGCRAAFPLNDDMEISAQFIRYAVVGVVSNRALYLAYLALTWAGMGHKTAMTLLYVVGVLLTFLFNRNWSFRHGGAASPAMLRYFAIYGFDYVFNFFVLLVLLDYLRPPPEIVQGVMIFALAVMLFLLQRYWVFRPETRTL